MFSGLLVFPKQFGLSFPKFSYTPKLMVGCFTFLWEFLDFFSDLHLVII
jgi:hypothetical protein